jgi:hypothetical protein
LSDSSIASIVSSALSTGALPTDSNGVYFVLTADRQQPQRRPRGGRNGVGDGA